MKQPTYFKIGLTILTLFLCLQSFSQNFVPFVPRYDEAIKGDMLLIGNSNIGVHITNPYTGNSNNESGTNDDRMVYVDIDNDPNTFNSSSANLDVPSDADCYQIAYAGLYWSSVVSGTTPMQNIKFKTPGSSNYIDIMGTQIYYQNNAANKSTSDTYVYYRDVTDILSTLGSNREGTYTVANISSMTSAMMASDDGYNEEGLSAGWSLFVIYEDPMLPSKYITSFDGYTKIHRTANPQQTFPISGFQTLPAPQPVRAKYAFSALEGDKGWNDDYLAINGTRIDVTDASNNVIRRSRPISGTPANFFNSSVSIIDPATNSPMLFTARTPASSNTLGFDAGIINIPNADKSVIANGATSADITLGTGTDTYYFYFSAFAIEIIAPNIVLTKVVEDDAGNDIGGQTVSLGDELYYTIGFQNTGNDDATDLIIRDILPDNVVFNYPSDIDLLELPAGVTHSYNSTTRELIFNVPNSLVRINNPTVHEIRFKVTVVSSCSLLSDACSNNIDNQAYATYKGTINPDFTISDDPSFASNTGCLVTPGATNFLANLNDCVFEENVILCGDSTVLTAGSGYDQYSWSTSPTGTPVIGTDQELTVTTPGTYYVHNTAVAPCQSIDQVFHVITYGVGVTNPVIPFADQVVECPNDGKLLPNIFLCGANDFTFIETNITDTSSMIWEKLDEASCDAVTDLDCANESDSCTWHQVATGPDFMADTAGQYRLTLNYTGGCFNQFYFNVYENLLEPTVTPRDIFCTTPGQITVGGVPNGYEYSIDGVNYQTSNEFLNITTPNTYTVYIRQMDVTPNPCIFTVPDVLIKQRDFTVSTTVVQPLCHGELGSIGLAANDVRPQYFFSISQGGSGVTSVGPIQDNNHTFSNLNPGTYTYEVSTQDGCVFSNTIEIINPPLLVATSALTIPLTCTDGEITVYPVGGTAPYSYFVNGATTSQSTPEIIVTAPGFYTIRVVDYNDCSTTTSITVDDIPEPEYTVDGTDILCYNSNDGVIQFDVTNANGYTIEYSIDNGTTYGPNRTFSNLSAGTYAAHIRYSMNGVECFSTSENIIITQPDSAVTASAGVSELACGGTGRVRITNPQGGTPPYEYSFDNQATWTTVNEAYVTPGTYTLYIRDANNCIYPMSGIVLDPEPVAPTIDVSDPDFNCDGSGNSTVTITNPDTSSFTYRYLLNGIENTNTTNPNIFLNVPDGTHTITVEYTLSTVPTYSNLLYETFGYGDDTTSPGINTTYYCFERQVVATQCKGNIQINDGDYSVTSHIVSPFSAWINPVDHTPPTNPVTPKGRYLVVNIGSTIPATEVLYEKQINDIIPNQPINVEFYAMNLLRSGNNQHDPNLTVALVDGSGTEISSFSTGSIPKSQQWEVYPKTPMTLDPGANTSLRFIVRSNVQQTSGNDVAIDDISVYQLPKVCTTTVDFPFIVASGNAFTAQIINTTNTTCYDTTDGTFTISAQNFDPAKGFQYSINNGTWNTQMTSPYTITGLAPGNYDILVRYENVVNTCVETLTQTITAPNPLVVSASGTPVTCLAGSTVTATATGGSQAYTFELLHVLSNLITPFPSNGILTDVAAGGYIVRVTDVNGCMNTTPLNLAAPTAIMPYIINADYCYDGNGASLEVGAAGGQAPYEYSINGSAYQTSNTFSNLTPGNYTITVRDAYGCTDTLSETIAPQLTVGTVLTNDLDCTGSPAVITGTISGGTQPFTVTLIQGAGTLSVSGNSFTLTTAISGTYQFRVTDANVCTAESGEEVLTTPVSVTASSAATSPTCNGDSDGTITLTALTGEAPFNYSIDGGITFVTSNVFGGLVAGSYNYVVRDSKGCETTAPATITLTDPAPIVPNIVPKGIQCNTVILGSFDIDITSGGTAPYIYKLYDNSFTEIDTYTTTAAPASFVHSFTNLDFGDYYITIVDAIGCEYKSGKLRIEPTPYMDVSGEVVNTSCASGVDVTLNVTGGVGDFTYSIYGDPSRDFGPTAATTHTFTGLDQGTTYQFKVVDSNGCPSYWEFTTGIISPININPIIATNVTCNGADNGEVSFTVNQYDPSTTDLYYEVRDNLTNMPIVPAKNGHLTGLTSAPANETITGLPAGNYTLYIKEFDGTTMCSTTKQFQITQPIQPLFSAVSSSVNANCNVAAQLTLNTTGGTGPYQYAVGAVGFTPSIADFNSSNVLYLDPSVRTNWGIVVRDNNGCEFRLNETIATDPEPVITADLNAQCNVTEGNFAIDVALTTAGVAPYSYSIDNGAFQTRTAPFTISNLASGTHTVEVMDFNGCGNLVIVDIEPPVDLLPTITALPSCDDNDGVITVTGSGGSGNYSFAISSSAGSITPTATGFSGVPSGTYTITITDTTTGCTKPATVTLEAATPVTFTTTPTDVTCNGGNDGMITVNLPVSYVSPISNNNPVYTYSLDGGVNTQNSNVFTGLAEGTYDITVISGRNCRLTRQAYVGEPAAITVPDPLVVQYACTAGTNTSNFATITVSGVSGGSRIYTRYEFIRDATPTQNAEVVQSGPNNVYTETNLLGGNYTINVYDDKGCPPGTTTTTINPFISLDALNITKVPIDCATNVEDITVSVTSSGVGTPNLRYTVKDIVGSVLGAVYSQTNTTTNIFADFTDLPVGNYIITVENLDTGCILEIPHYVSNPNTFDLAIDPPVDVTCFSASDGSVNVTFIDRSPIPTDESGAFSYEVFNVTDLVNPVASGTTTDVGLTIPNLAAGTYEIIASLINPPYCDAKRKFTITAPTAALAIAETHTEITCVSGNNDGTISASATGGWPGGYEYQLEDSTGIIVPFGTISNFTGLTPDTYTVTVKDSRDCEDFVTVLLEIPDPIIPTATTNMPMLSCFGDSNATITASAYGGQGSNYTYTLNMVSPTMTSSGPQLSPVFNGLGAGTYTVTVTDGYNCTATSANVLIEAPAPVQASLVKATSQTCLTESQLTLSATGGTGSYEYSDTALFATILGSFTSSVPITFSVPVGTYQYYVRDSNACEANVSNEITIDPLPILNINFEENNPTINCVGDNTGVIVAVAQGGLGNYIYMLLDGSGNPIPTVPQNSDGVFTGLLAGDYQVLVNSGIDCQTLKSITITEPTTALVAAFDPTDATCFGSGDGRLVITASGGTGIIKYAISPQLNQFFETFVFEDLYPGTYQAIAQDEKGCYILREFTIDEPAPIQIAVIPSSIQPELCEGDLNGAFSVVISGGTLPYNVALDDRNGSYIIGDPTQTVFDFPGLRGGNHTVYVIDGAGCEWDVEIAFPDSVSFEPLARVDYGCDNNLPSNTVTVTVTGNANPADLTYSLDGGTYQTSNVFVNVPSGVGHYVDVMHANGCTQRTELFDIIHYDPVTLVLEDGTLNQIVAVTAGGSGVFQYTLNGEDYGSANTFLIYRSGDYTVTVTDSYGCTASATRYFEYIDVCIPNYFTPATEQWGPGCTSQYINLTVDIFDRYGREIATLRVGDTWDGNYNGKELPSGDYWYIVKLNDPKDDRDFVGHFTLYR